MGGDFAASWPPGDSELACRIRSHDWSDTSLGTIGEWPQCLRTAIEVMLASPQPAYVGWGPDLTSFFNDAYLPFLEGKRQPVLGRPFRKVWSELLPALEEDLASTLSGTASAFEDQLFHLPARTGSEEGWFSGSWIPLRDAESRVAGFMAIFIETTGRVLAERNLRKNMEELERAQTAQAANEERLRLATESANIFAWEIDEKTGQVHYSTNIAEAFGFDPRGSFDQSRLIEMVHPEDRPAVAHGMKEARTHIGRYQGEYRARVKDGWLWVYTVVDAHRGPNGEIERWIGMSQDISQHKKAEQRQSTLLAELQHRVRNILAMIRSIARRTGDTCGTVEDYAQHLEGRISALARTQALLTRSPGTGVDLRNMILEELRSHSAADRVRLSGSNILVAPKAAEVLTLAIHELATNSVKYGALGPGDGRLSVCWRRQRRGDGEWLGLSWHEQGTAGLARPVRRGFGTELITRRVPYELHGRGQMVFHRTGLSARIEFPMVEGESILQTSAASQTGGAPPVAA